MKNIICFLLLILCGCDSRFQAVEELKPTLNISPEAIHTEPITATVQPGALTVEKGVELNINVPKNAIHVDPITMKPVFSVSPDSVKMNFSVSPEAVKLVVPQEAIKIAFGKDSIVISPQVTLTVAPGAIVVHGAEIEKGAISTSPWIIGLLILLGLAYIITKVRKQNLPRSRDMGKSSIWDILF
jgi:hypothetical protein